MFLFHRPFDALLDSPCDSYFVVHAHGVSFVALILIYMSRIVQERIYGQIFVYNTHFVILYNSSERVFDLDEM